MVAVSYRYIRSTYGMFQSIPYTLYPSLAKSVPRNALEIPLFATDDHKSERCGSFNGAPFQIARSQHFWHVYVSPNRHCARRAFAVLLLFDKSVERSSNLLPSCLVTVALVAAAIEPSFSSAVAPYLAS